MRTAIYIFILAGLLTSCGITIKEQREKYCAQLKNKALREIDKGNLRPVLKGKHLYSDVERYYIWSKYKINIAYPINLNEFYQVDLDSCYNSIMLENAPISEITRDLDSLTQLDRNSDYEYPKSKYIRKFHDEFYSVGVDANNKSFAPTRIDTNYHRRLEEFKVQFEESLSDTLKCEFWYEIDTLGNVKNVEIVEHATEKIDKAVKEFYSSFRFIPANDGSQKLNFRNNDFIYFLGKQNKKRTCQH